MPAKQKVKKTKSSKPVRDEMMDAFDSIVGEVDAPETVVETTPAETTTKKKKGNSNLANVRRLPKSETLITVLGRKYTKVELHSKVLQASGKSLIAETILRDNIKRILHSEKFVELLPAQQKSYSFGSRALPILKENIEFKLTNLLYIANVIAVSKGKTTIGEGDVLLAELIMRGKLNIHGDKTKTQDAVIRSQTKSKRETISLGQDVNIDNVNMVLSEAMGKSDTQEVTSTALLGNPSDKLKKLIALAEEKLKDHLTSEPTKKRKMEDIETKEEEQEEEQEEEKVEPEVKKAPAKKTTKETKEDKKKNKKEEEEVEEPKPKKKKVEKKTTKK